MMEDKIWTKKVLAGNRLSTIFELQENEVTERPGNAEVSKTHRSSTATEKLPGKQCQDSQIQPAVLPTAYSECSADSPLKGTPWEDAVISSVARNKSRQVRRKRSLKEQEHSRFWLKFFG